MAWEFTDDRGVTVRSERRPERVAAYLRAGAGLVDLGVRPVAVYGSGHDGDRPDPAKWGPEAPAGIPYLGASGALDEERLLSERPDLIVDVTYDGKHAYAVDDGAAERAHLPVLALSVAGEVPQARLLERFAELAVALGGRDGEGTERLADAEARLRTAALRAPASGCWRSPRPGRRRSTWPVRRPGRSCGVSSASGCGSPTPARRAASTGVRRAGTRPSGSSPTWSSATPGATPTSRPPSGSCPPGGP
ncbi:ABC transporter substrate-binding protein [Streptomyces albus]|nr:ABC transporter substrate-binding protein [Streptomyces albus]